MDTFTDTDTDTMQARTARYARERYNKQHGHEREFNPARCDCGGVGYMTHLTWCRALREFYGVTARI